MMGTWGVAAILVAVAAALIWLVRTNLQQREISRRLRIVFIAEAGDLIGKPEFPDAHARMLASMASIPQGWATRFFVIALAKRLLFGESSAGTDGPRLEQVPSNLRRKYVLAMLAFVLSDSYRCVIFGRIFRATNSWIGAAVDEPKEDVNAHATKVVIEQVSRASARKVSAIDDAMALA